MRRVSNEERRRRLGLRHFLARPAETLEAAADGLVGLHASDPASVYLSALARRPATTIAEMDAALYDGRSLVRVLGMRRTMFAVTPETARIVDAACTRALSAVQHRRLESQLEAGSVVPDPRTWIARMGDRVVEDLRINGEATTRELVRRLPQLDIRFTLGQGRWAAEVGIASRLLFLLATDLRVVRARPLGSWLSSQYRWVATEDWMGLDAGYPPEDALAMLVDRWLRSYGPGALEDLVWWTGLTKRAVTSALDAAGALQVELDDGPGWVAGDDVDGDIPQTEWIALLPALDATTMGWKRREWYLDSAMVGHLFDVNGNAGPTVWVNGRVVGGWGQRGDGSVAVELLEQPAGGAREAIDFAAGRLTEWFGGTVATPRFRTPVEKRIAAG
jgi:hypothetical protein